MDTNAPGYMGRLLHTGAGVIMPKRTFGSKLCPFHLSEAGGHSSPVHAKLTRLWRRACDWATSSGRGWAWSAHRARLSTAGGCCRQTQSASEPPGEHFSHWSPSSRTPACPAWSLQSHPPPNLGSPSGLAGPSRLGRS